MKSIGKFYSVLLTLESFRERAKSGAACRMTPQARTQSPYGQQSDPQSSSPYGQHQALIYDPRYDSNLVLKQGRRPINKGSQDQDRRTRTGQAWRASA
jgi:hypothetical protein